MNYRNPLFRPGYVLKGKDLKRAANAASRLEYSPIISAHRQQLRALARQRMRDQKGLARLGRQTLRGMNRSYAGTNALLGQGVAASQQQGENLMAESAGIQNQTNQRMAGLAEGATGQNLAALSGRNLQAGEADKGLADAIAARMANSTMNQNALAETSNKMATGMADTARNRQAAGRMAQNEASNAVRSAILSRRADSRAAYGDAQNEVRGSLRNARSLKGATTLNNLMRLRDSERRFGNERSAMMLDARQANMENQLGYAKLENDSSGSGGGSGGGSGSDDNETPKRMTNSEWREWLEAANGTRDGKVAPGGFGRLIDDAADKFDIDWTATERNAFLKRYRQWYNKNVLNN